MSRVSTVYLLTCAAIGVATGILIVPATALSTLTHSTLPPVSALLAGAWVIGYVIAMRLTERPGAAIIAGLVSGVVAAPLSTTGPAIVITNVMFAAFIELPFLLTLYRRWGRGLYYAGAGALATVYGAYSVISSNMQSFAPWVLVLYVAALFASAIGAVALGLLIADRLRRAGVAKLARRRASVV